MSSFRCAVVASAFPTTGSRTPAVAVAACRPLSTLSVRLKERDVDDSMDASSCRDVYFVRIAIPPILDHSVGTDPPI